MRLPIFLLGFFASLSVFGPLVLLAQQGPSDVNKPQWIVIYEVADTDTQRIEKIYSEIRVKIKAATEGEAAAKALHYISKHYNIDLDHVTFIEVGLVPVKKEDK